jgi:hypothetical protein
LVEPYVSGSVAAVFSYSAAGGSLDMGLYGVNIRRYFLFLLVSLLDPSIMTWYWSNPSQLTTVPLLS